MPVETYEALLAMYSCASEHWRFSHRTKHEASECIEEIMNENLPRRWTRVRLKKCARTQNWLPYSYLTVKSKCYKEKGRVFEKKKTDTRGYGKLWRARNGRNEKIGDWLEKRRVFLGGAPNARYGRMWCFSLEQLKKFFGVRMCVSLSGLGDGVVRMD